MSAGTGPDPHHASADAGARPDSETQQVINRGRCVLHAAGYRPSTRAITP